MVRVRFAPSPTGSLHLGSALTAVANRRFADENGGTMLLRIDDTDRVVEGAEEAILEDLGWLGLAFEGEPVRQSERGDRHREVARSIGTEDAEGAVRFGHITLLRPDGRPTYHRASVVDDADLEISPVIRGKDHLPNAKLHESLARALGAEPPQYVHHGLLVGDDGKKLSKRQGAASLAELRERGIPAEAVRRYLEELGLPRGDVHFDDTRLRRLALETIAGLSDEELAARVGAPVSVVPALRGAHDLAEAEAIAAAVSTPPPPGSAPPGAGDTLARVRELREGANGDLEPETARSIVSGVRAAGGDLRALRLALTGAERGPELWTIVLALPRDEALRRIDAAL